MVFFFHIRQFKLAKSGLRCCTVQKCLLCVFISGISKSGIGYTAFTICSVSAAEHHSSQSASELPTGLRSAACRKARSKRQSEINKQVRFCHPNKSSPLNRCCFLSTTQTHYISNSRIARMGRARSRVRARRATSPSSLLPMFLDDLPVNWAFNSSYLFLLNNSHFDKISKT